MNDSASSPVQVTPEGLIGNTVATLRNDEEVDAELLDILASNIITLNPAETAVSDAVKAIERLASNRTESLANAPTDNY